MAYIYRRDNNIWYVAYRSRGRLLRQSLKTKNKRVALRDLAKFQLAEHEGDRVIKSVDKVRLGPFVETHLELSSTENSPGWIKIKKYIWRKHLLPFFGATTHLESIDQLWIEKYRAKRLRAGAAPKTINNEVRVLIRGLNHAAEIGLLNPRSVPRMKRLKESAGRLRFLSEEEIKSFLSASGDTSKGFNDNVKAFCSLLLCAGLRRREAIFLRWRDIDFGQRQIVICEHESRYHGEVINFVPKGKKLRRIAIIDSFYEFLFARRQSPAHADDELVIGDAYRDSLERVVPRVADAAGIPNEGEDRVTAHVLRHTFASHLVMSGVSLYEVAALLGHSSIETTKIYAHLAPEHLDRSVQALNNLNLDLRLSD